MEIPFVDLKRQHESIMDDIEIAIKRVLNHHDFILGREVQAFEQEWAEYLGVKYVIAGSSGTDALILPLIAGDIGSGDEVITVANTFFATVEAIVAVGAKPVLVDVQESNGLIDPVRISSAINERSRAVIPVHLYGHPADTDAILDICQKNGLVCIEDCAQAHGATYNGIKIGNSGLAAAFSFYPGKNLGAMGDAGAVVTNDQGLAEEMYCLRDHGRSKKYEHRRFGWNMRMDGMQAAILRAKLPHLNRWNQCRRQIASLYNKELANLDKLRLLTVAPNVEHSYHLYVAMCEQRDKLHELLLGEKISTGIHYPVPCHLQTAWKNKYGTISLPVTERFAACCLSLPIFGEMRDEEANGVIEGIRKVLPML